jgi:hypothetical protein
MGRVDRLLDREGGVLMKRHVWIVLVALMLSACVTMGPAPQWQLDMASWATERC